MEMKRAVVLVALIAFALVRAAPVAGQFTPAFIQNSSYWNDGKAEFDIYDAMASRARPKCSTFWYANRLT